jgi:oligoendopeptidase F
MTDWSDLTRLVVETSQRLYVATTVNTADKEAEQRYLAFLDEIYPAIQAADQKLKENLLASELEPEGFSIPLRNLRAEAGLFREANLPLLAEELKLVTEYDRIIGAQTVEWESRELTVSQLEPYYLDPDRSRRERAWRLGLQRWLADREAINALWVKFMNLRGQIAANAGYEHYRAYRWVQMLRFDYMPEDCYRFHQAIEDVVLPAAHRLVERRRQRLGVDRVRPWDLKVDPLSDQVLRPFKSVAELEDKTTFVLQHVDPQLGQYFNTMCQENLLDLDNRKNKAPGGYMTEFAVARRPFFFTNTVGVHDDVQTMLHEAGHAFHVFETNHLPYFQQLEPPIEFAEVASTAMELLTAPFLDAVDSFYSPSESARAQLENLERSLLFWPYMAVVDAFQHWVYENHQAAMDPANCDAKWAELWGRFMPFEDWSGLEEEVMTGWHRKGHIHQDPFYYIEYGMAQLGAVQVWRNSIQDQAGAVVAYRRALSLGGTATLSELYAAAGARFAFDSDTLLQAVELMETTMQALEAIVG